MTDEKLKDERPIDDKAKEELKEFIGQLESPICLIAHYGIEFDFPLLKRDFKECFPAAVKVVDSIDLFRCHQKMFTSTGSVISFKLKDVHKRFFKEDPIIQHEATHDVQTLIRCLLHVTKCPRMLCYNEQFEKNVSKYCKCFATIDEFSR